MLSFVEDGRWKKRATSDRVSSRTLPLRAVKLQSGHASEQATPAQSKTSGCFFRVTVTDVHECWPGKTACVLLVSNPSTLGHVTIPICVSELTVASRILVMMFPSVSCLACIPAVRGRVKSSYDHSNVCKDVGSVTVAGRLSQDRSSKHIGEFVCNQKPFETGESNVPYPTYARQSLTFHFGGVDLERSPRGLS